MRGFLLCGWLLVLPIASSFITYAIVAAKNTPISLDPTQSAILALAILKFVLLGGLGVFPIDMDKLFHQVKRDQESRPRRDVAEGSEMGPWGGQRLFEVPSVDSMPCIRRLFCEIETAARTSDAYGQQESQNTVDRHLEEEVDVEETDPLTELYIEAIRAMYGHDEPSSPDSTRATERALQTVKALTGDSCERAYKMCSGRYTAPMVFKRVFQEMNFRARDEL